MLKQLTYPPDKTQKFVTFKDYQICNKLKALSNKELAKTKKELVKTKKTLKTLMISTAEKEKEKDMILMNLRC